MSDVIYTTYIGVLSIRSLGVLCMSNNSDPFPYFKRLSSCKEPVMDSGIFFEQKDK